MQGRLSGDFAFGLSGFRTLFQNEYSIIGVDSNHN
jgi:hypothetical protein